MLSQKQDFFFPVITVHTIAFFSAPAICITVGFNKFKLLCFLHVSEPNNNESPLKYVSDSQYIANNYEVTSPTLLCISSFVCLHNYSCHIFISYLFLLGILFLL